MNRELKSRRQRELDELRSRGVAKTRREKLKDFSGPLQTALESKQFLVECSDQSKSGMPMMNPASMSAIDYSSFLMQQTKRQRELKMRKREAEQLLHGFRGFYGEAFNSWSPRHAKKERNSFGAFGFAAEDSLQDPDDDSSSRRQTAQARLGEYRDSERSRKRSTPNPLDPRRTDFLSEYQHYDGTRYPRTDQEMEVASGVSMFSPRAHSDFDNLFRDRYPSSTRSSASERVRNFFRDNREDLANGHPSTSRSLTLEPNEYSKNNFSFEGRETHHSMRRASTSAREGYFEDDAFKSEERGRHPSPSQSLSSARKSTFDDAFSGAFLKAEVGSNKVNTREGVQHQTSNDREEREPSASNKSSSKESRMNLQINTERGDEINISASKETLRQDDDERDDFPETTWSTIKGDRPALSNEEGESNTKQPTLRVDEQPSQPSQPIERHAPKVTISESTPREEVTFHDQKAEPVPVTVWRDFISSEPGAKFPPEAGRYHLYASYACPGSHRALIVRALKGLQDIISVTIVHPTWRHTNPNNRRDRHRGWIFGDPNGEPFHNTMGRGGPFPAAYEDNDPDPILGAYSVRNIYEYSEDTSGKYTIPLLWDTKLNTIVNNESSDISYMLNSSFNDFSKVSELDLYTEDDEDGLDRLNEVSQWLYPMMIHGVYRCGFAKTQQAYDIAIEELTDAFDAADELLQHQRYLTGDTLTDADIRFFVTLIRFDEVYAFYFRANTRLVLMTPALLNFCREIYQMPGIARTCQMDQIKAHFFGSHAEWNKYSVVPRGLDFMRYLAMPHDREKFSEMSHC